MPRISRRATIGIKVTKAPGIKSVSGEKQSKMVVKVTAEQGAEPHVIDRVLHKQFVKNVFSMRGKSAAVICADT